MTMHSAKQAEAQVEKDRLALEATLAGLRRNMRPAHLAQEVLSGGRWFGRFQHFARSSPISWAVMTAAALGIGVQASRLVKR